MFDIPTIFRYFVPIFILLLFPMRATFLDLATLSKNDLDDTKLRATADWQLYDFTDEHQLDERLSNINIVVSNKVNLEARHLERAKALKLICVSATGTNNVDLNAAKALNIPVCNVTAYGTQAVAQHTLMLMLLLTSRFKAYQNDIKQGVWQQAKEFCLMDHPVYELNGKTLGIVGYGELGQAVASLAKAFGMQVLIAERKGDEPRTGRVSFETCIKQSDFISVHCPLNSETNALISTAEFNLMKPSACVINTARGGIVDEAALQHALLAEQIAGAAVDVLTAEPPTRGHPLLDLDHPNFIVTPHNAWVALEARQRLLDEVAKNIEAFLSGQYRNRVV